MPLVEVMVKTSMAYRLTEGDMSRLARGLVHLGAAFEHLAAVEETS